MCSSQNLGIGVLNVMLLFGCAVISFAGVYAASMVTGKGPVTLLLEHVADPVHNSVLQTLSQ